MPKYNLEKIIQQLQNSPAIKAIQAIENSPAIKAMQAMENSPAIKAMQAMENSSTMKAIRAMENSPTIKAMLAMENSSTMKAIRAMENSPTIKAMLAMENSSTMKAIRAMENSPAIKAMLAMENSPAMKAMKDYKTTNSLKKLRENPLFNNFLVFDQNTTGKSLHEQMIEYFSSQATLQDSDSTIPFPPSNTEYIAHNSTITDEEENSSSMILCILFSFFISFSSNQAFNKLSTGVTLDLGLAFIFEYALKPIVDEAIKNTAGQDECDLKTSTDFSNQETLNTFLSNKRVITNTLDFLELPKKKSSIIENLPPGTLLTVIPDKTIPKSWLKVKITLDQSEVEGYVLRRYTSPIK